MQLLKVINNISESVVDDLRVKTTSYSKLFIVAASFSIYAYDVLKAELENVDVLRFVFTSPKYITGNVKKEKQGCFILILNRERYLYGSDFGVKLSNRLLRAPPRILQSKVFNIFTRLVECFYSS